MKKIITIAIILVAIFTVVGCSNESDVADDAQNNQPEDSNTTVEENEVISEDVLITKNIDGFEIVDSVLIAYSGTEAEIVIPDGVIAIDESVFDNNADIIKVTMPTTLKSIGYRAFNSAMILEEVILNEGLEIVGQAAFELCENLTTITLPSTLKTVEFMAFQDCINMSNIIIPESVETISDQGFYRCSSLGKVMFDSNDVVISATAFEECGDLIFVCDEGSAAEKYLAQVENPDNNILNINLTIEYK